MSWNPSLSETEPNSTNESMLLTAFSFEIEVKWVLLNLETEMKRKVILYYSKAVYMLPISVCSQDAEILLALDRLFGVPRDLDMNISKCKTVHANATT